MKSLIFGKNLSVDPTSYLNIYGEGTLINSYWDSPSTSALRFSAFFSSAACFFFAEFLSLSLALDVYKRQLQNERVAMQVDRQGHVISYTLDGRAMAAGRPMNVLRMYKDVPRIFDACLLYTSAACEPLEAEPLQPVMTPESINAAHRVAIIFFFTLESLSLIHI